MHYPLPWFPLSDDPSRCSCRTIRGCRPYRSSHAGCRFGRSGSSGSVGGFRRLRLSNRGLVPAARRNPGRCRYRYTCRPGGLLAANGCHPKRSGFGFRGRSRLNHAGMTFLKLPDWFSDDLCLSFCPRRRRCRTKFLLCRFFEDFGFNQLVMQIVEIVLHFAVSMGFQTTSKKD